MLAGRLNVAWRHLVWCGVAWLLALQGWAMLQAPDAWLPALVTLRLMPGQSASLAPLARATVTRDAAGGWWLAAQPDAAPPTLYRGDTADAMASMPVPAGPLTLPGGHSAPRQDAAAGAVAFSLGGVQWRYDGALLLRDGRPQPPCPDDRWPALAAAYWNRWAPVWLSLARPLSLGGNLHCANRVGIAGTLPNAAALWRAEGELRMSDLERRPRALEGVSAIGLAGLRLAVPAGARGGADTLLLQPQRRVPAFAGTSGALPEGVKWQWTRRVLWPAAPQDTLSTLLATVLGLATAAALLAARSGLAGRASAVGGGVGAEPAARSARRLGAWPDGAGLAGGAKAPGVAGSHAVPGAAAARLSGMAGAGAVLAAGVLALALQRLWQAPAPALSCLLAALALYFWLRNAGGPSLTTGAAALLLAAGLLLQLELGLGSGDLRYYQKTAALLAIGLAVLALWRQLRPAERQPIEGPRAAERLLLPLALAALAALAAQVLWGDETGVFELQPVELAKLALTALAAHCLALRLGWHETPRWSRWAALSAPVLLFCALLAFALVQVDDYSPLVMLLAWAGGMALAYCCIARHKAMASALCAAMLAIGAASGAVREAGAAALPGDFYSDRFQVWLAPAAHPHTGQQLLRAAAAIAQGGLAGADSSFGLRALGLPAGPAATIPAVQDDFAPSFFINRHGLVAAVLLWVLQAAFLAGLLQQALHAAAQAAPARDYRSAWSARFRCFALCGGACFVAAHLALSWGTNLGILPVMGQPMSFLSAGGSHLLFFLLPLLGLSAASNEE